MTAADRIRARIAELDGIRERYLAYQQDRVNERDHHGAWDVAVNLSETECELAGLRFALNAIDDQEIVGQPAVEERRAPRARWWIDPQQETLCFKGFDGKVARWDSDDLLGVLKANGFTVMKEPPRP